ncbi:MAG: D-2-hydroxyacid dehydrogenase [Anaerolineae bacterium]
MTTKSDPFPLLNVLVTMNFTDAQLDKLRAVSPRFHVEQRPRGWDKAVGEVLDPNVDILYAANASFSLAQVPQLRWVQLHSAGVEHIANSELWRSDIPITNVSGIHAVPIAEYVWAQILAFAHRLPAMLRFQEKGEWAHGRWENFAPRDLRGQTIGLVGYGAIGREVARLAQAFGMRVLATKRSARDQLYRGWRMPGVGDNDGSIPERYYAPEEIPEMLSVSDYIVISAPLTPATRHLIGAAELAVMKPSAFLVNIARGGLIDQQALIEALRAGRLAGAGLDVFDPEPLPADSPLWAMDNVVISPHVSGFNLHYDDWATDLFAENLRRFLADEPLINLIDRREGY